MVWKPQKVLKAVTWQSEPWEVEAYVYKGLALRIEIQGSPKGRRKPTYSLMHIGSGHNVCFMTGTVADVFPAAYELAESADWTFGGLEGWRNQEPDLPAKIKEWMNRHKGISNGFGNRDEVMASKIAAAMS